jgi:hypothetical protein
MLLNIKRLPVKCAIIHDCILEFGGAERVLASLLKLFPNADIYTLAAQKSVLKI